MPEIGDTKAPCEYCSKYFVRGAGLTNHERGCSLNPARRPQKKRVRKTCPKCRTLIDGGNFYRHVQVCKGRKEEPILLGPPPVFPTTEDSSPLPIHLTPPVTRERGGALPKETTSELLVELLFPNGVMPTHPEFVRAFRAWLDATDKLVAIAGMDS